MSSNLAQSALMALLSQQELRRRIIFRLQQDYFSDLNISIPIGKDLTCPITTPGHFYSFSEVFVDQEYCEALRLIPAPERWIDLGCHAGYFSLFLIWMKLKERSEFNALLIDADPRTGNAVQKTIAANKLSRHLKFIHGAIGPAGPTVPFQLDQVMSSGIRLDNTEPPKAGRTVNVAVLPEQTIMERFAPPYNLVKADIEGAEFYLLQEQYQRLLAATHYLLLEWHSWQPGGGANEQIVQMAESRGFELKLDGPTSHTVSESGAVLKSGLLLFENKSKQSN